MNKTILRHLYDGELNPSESIGTDNDKLKFTLDMLSEEKELFSKTLTDDNRENFCNINKLYYEILDTHGYECFTYGFKLGIMLMHERWTAQVGFVVKK